MIWYVCLCSIRAVNIHQPLSEHITSEYHFKTETGARIVYEWKLKTVRPDNYWFDCIVGAAVAASIQGAKLFGADEGHLPSEPSRYAKV